MEEEASLCASLHQQAMVATQIQDEAVKFSKTSRIACTCLYGGAPKGPQLRDIDRG
ncbi:DEAD-box ATP-dependent RNA helicase, partial [Trifolium medium]|nr:DEAD-box ATP-dependent RNA helicase [Trifolium medium]